jgi:cell division protein ZapA
MYNDPLNQEKTVLTVNILGKEYKIGCSADLQNSLLYSAKFLDHKMREIRDQYHVIGADKIAVLAALHITHELLHNNSKHTNSTQALESKLSALYQKITDNI